jgi:hypothetical protein
MTIRAAAAVLCVVVALAGCSSDPEPQPLPPIGTSSPSPVALPLPSEAAAETPEGAAAFARYWMQVLETALAKGDATQLRRLSDEGCGGCNNLIGAVEGGEPGETIRGAELVVQFTEAPPVENGETIVTLRYTRQAGELVAADGSTATPIAPEGPIDAEMRVRRAGTSWIVLGFRGTST